MNSSNLDVNNCADSDKVITRYSECKSQLVSTNTSYRKMKEVENNFSKLAHFFFFILKFQNVFFDVLLHPAYQH